MDPYGLQAWQLAQACGVSIDTARRWKRLERIPPVPNRLVQWWLRGDLGAIAPAWSGFTLRANELWTPYGFAVRPGEISALAYRAALISELQRALAEPRQLALWR